MVALVVVACCVRLPLGIFEGMAIASLLGTQKGKTVAEPEGNEVCPGRAQGCATA